MKKTKHRWFRIHLSTAIVLMFAASGFLWANLTPEIRTFHVGALDFRSPEKNFPVRLQECYGWPCFIAVRYSSSHETKTEFARPLDFFYNFIAALVALLFVAAILEWALKKDALFGALVILSSLLFSLFMNRGLMSRKLPESLSSYEQTAVLVQRSLKLLDDATQSLRKGDIEDAKLSIDLAKGFGVSNLPECKKAFADVETQLKALEKTKRPPPPSAH